MFSNDTHQPYTIKIIDTILKIGIYKINYVKTSEVMEMKLVYDWVLSLVQGEKEKKSKNFKY